MNIFYFDRYKGQVCEEQVYGGDAVKFVYQNPLGKLFWPLLAGRAVSKIYGKMQDLPSSRKKISTFIDQFEIDMDEFEEVDYQNFNEFFIRRFRSGKRPFEDNNQALSAFAEARYFAYESLSEKELIPVKGHYMSSSALLNHKNWAQVFWEGPCLLARLCPVDYHRFHFPVDGKIIDHYRIPGKYHSVNPWALESLPSVFMKNERQVTVVQSETLGHLALIDVGAMCVGKIVQQDTWKVGSQVQRGQEKGYFLFGGSTVILLGEKGMWSPSHDLLEQTHQGRETYIKLGDTIAFRK